VGLIFNREMDVGILKGTNIWRKIMKFFDFVADTVFVIPFHLKNKNKSNLLNFVYYKHFRK
jgi:hypothetical protein